MPSSSSSIAEIRVRRIREGWRTLGLIRCAGSFGPRGRRWSSGANEDVVSVIKLGGFTFLLGSQGSSSGGRNKGWGTGFIFMGSRSVAMHSFMRPMYVKSRSEPHVVT